MSVSRQENYCDKRRDYFDEWFIFLYFVIHSIILQLITRKIKRIITVKEGKLTL